MTEAELFNLMEVAAKGEHTKFEFIKSLDGWRAARVVRRVLKKTAKAFRAGADNAVDRYLDQIAKGNYKTELYEAALAYEKYAAFYEKELDTVEDMLDEFYCYFFKGHIIHILLGGQRHVYDLLDYRILTKCLKGFR